MAPTQISTLSLHDALPIWRFPKCTCAKSTVASRPTYVSSKLIVCVASSISAVNEPNAIDDTPDRKSTRLNSSHANISYAVFCLKKKKKKEANRHDDMDTSR